MPHRNFCNPNFWDLYLLAVDTWVFPMEIRVFQTEILKKWTKNAKKIPIDNCQCARKVCKYLL